jgi:hypothetical protein
LRDALGFAVGLALTAPPGTTARVYVGDEAVTIRSHATVLVR